MNRDPLPEPELKLAPATAAPVSAPVRVWDLPTRSFHWLLALAVIGAVVSAKVGGNAMVWHFRLGYAIFTLLAFRLLWGVVGGRWSRFGSFLYAPGALLRYLCGASRADEHHEAGHSPLGALSVFALLAVLIAQVASGLCADDEIASTGPLVKYISGATSSALTGWHKGYGQVLIFTLVGLHVLAIGIYTLVKKRALVGAMIGGDKLLHVSTPASRDTTATRALALLLLAACAAGVGWVASLGD